MTTTALPSGAEAGTQPLLEQLTALSKASGDRLRLLILRVLCNDSFGVLELCEILDVRQPSLSHHLKILAAAGLVATRREGNSVFYRRGNALPGSPLQDLHNALLLSVDGIELPAAIAAHIHDLHEQRSQRSRDFFSQNADKFHQQQDLIASYEQYADTVAAVLDDAPMPAFGSALEIGPGDGAFLVRLGQRFAQVTGVDNAEQMLAKARTRIDAAGLNTVKLIHGDTRHPDLAQLQVDCAIINMVLHHNPSPASMLADTAACLKPGGLLLVTDLCRHDQAWARDTCGDVWLGFDPADLSQWAQDAGLQDVSSQFLAQRNGFQVQVRLFSRPPTDNLKQGNHA